MAQKSLACFQKIGNKRYDDDEFVHLTIYDIPVSLLNDFCDRIVNPNYPGGISDAIKDLMQKAAAQELASHNDTSSAQKPDEKQDTRTPL